MNKNELRRMGVDIQFLDSLEYNNSFIPNFVWHEIIRDSSLLRRNKKSPAHIFLPGLF